MAGGGLYSFKGSGYVRGGIFDRVEIVQHDAGFRFRDRDHQRLADIAAEGAPALREVALFVVPQDARSIRWRHGACNSWCSACSASRTRPS